MERDFKIVSSMIGGSDTLWGCNKCGLVVWNREIHIDVFHCGPDDG